MFLAVVLLHSLHAYSKMAFANKAAFDAMELNKPTPFEHLSPTMQIHTMREQLDRLDSYIRTGSGCCQKGTRAFDINPPRLPPEFRPKGPLLFSNLKPQPSSKPQLADIAEEKEEMDKRNEGSGGEEGKSDGSENKEVEEAEYDANPFWLNMKKKKKKKKVYTVNGSPLTDSEDDFDACDCAGITATPIKSETSSPPADFTDVDVDDGIRCDSIGSFEDKDFNDRMEKLRQRFVRPSAAQRPQSTGLNILVDENKKNEREKEEDDIPDGNMPVNSQVESSTLPRNVGQSFCLTLSVLFFVFYLVIFN